MDLTNPLPKWVDMMTGYPVQKPAMSPYGHVLGYATWCKILRTPATRNLCPFTKLKMTRRQLVKLTVDNIGEYKKQLRNLTEEEKENMR